LQKYGKNRAVTIPTQIQICKGCDTVGVMRCEWHVGSEGTREGGFRVQVEGFRPAAKGFRSFPVIFGLFRSFPVISGHFLKIKSASRTGHQAWGARWVSHQPSAFHGPIQFIRPNPAMEFLKVLAYGPINKLQAPTSKFQRSSKIPITNERLVMRRLLEIRPNPS